MLRSSGLTFVFMCAVAIILPLIAMATASSLTPIGSVLQANQATVGGYSASSGTTIFDADSLQTGPAGVLSISVGESQIYLRPETEAIVHSTAESFSVDLARGATVLSSHGQRGFRISVGSVTVRTREKQATIAEVTWVDRGEFLLTSTRGSLEIDTKDESRTINPGASYRISIQPNDSEPRGNSPAGTEHGNTANHRPTAGGQTHLAIALISAVPVTAAIGISRMPMSPTSP